MEKISLTDIVPAEYNPRKISDEEFKLLSDSIDNFGLVDPIIINLNNNKIIGGHQRYDVLLNKYMDDGLNSELNLIRLGDIGWVFPNDNIKFNKKDYLNLNVALNKISGEWDTDKLNSLLNDLDNCGFDISLTGFEGLDDSELIFDDDKSVDEIDDLFDSEMNDIEFNDTDNELDYEDVIYDEGEIKYELIFKDEKSNDLWYKFINSLNKHPNESIAETIIKVFNECLKR